MSEITDKVAQALEEQDKPFKEIELVLLWLRVPLLQERTKLQREYYQAREKLRVPKDKEYTDFDRTIMNEAYCAEIRQEYEYVKGLEDLVTERLEFYRANH